MFRPKATPHHIIITGASSGIGTALAHAYAGPDIVLGLTGRDQARLAAVAAACQRKGADVRLYHHDVCDASSLAVWLEESWAYRPIDLVIANAGISGGSAGLSGMAWPEALDQIHAIMNVNLIGALNSIMPVLPYMRARGSGQIALMSSMAGFCGMPSAPAYSTSKVALRCYGDALRPLLRAYNIDISVICPGFVRTPLTDQNDFKMPFLMEPDRAASIIMRGLAQRRRIIAFPFVLYMFVRVLAALPLPLRDIVLSKLEGKKPLSNQV